MQDRDILELFKAALAVAAADGKLSRSEMGVVEGLAAKVGIGKVSFDAMTSAAMRGEPLADAVSLESPEVARKALTLLVGEARIDGEISDEERSILVLIAERLGIGDEEFQAVYKAGVQHADEVRRRRA